MAHQKATSNQFELLHKMKPNVFATSDADALSKDLEDSLFLVIRCLFHLTMNTAVF